MVTDLHDAIRDLIRPGDHLHFAATPSRSNSAVRALADVFIGTDPGFVVSTTGLHSTAHLLGQRHLARRYLSCFVGDTYPHPGPNRLYTRLEAAGVVIELWSLLLLIAALRAGASGLGHAVVRTAGHTDLVADLVRLGRVRRCADLDPQETLVAAIRPDVTLLHAAVADEAGRVALFAPLGEGLWSSLAARRGVIATVERVLSPAEFDRLGAAAVLPPHRVAAVCPGLGAARPQPLWAPDDLGYGDDFDEYVRWSDHTSRAPSTGADVTIRAARVIARQIKERNHRCILAGIGQPFLAARLARLLLARTGLDIPVMVETGIYDVDCGPANDNYLLGYRTIAGARQRADIEQTLGVLACGADNRCLAVIGAAEIDASGAINTTRSAAGVLTGSGGAHDLASGADEIVVVVPCDLRRLPAQVTYVTSPGRAVTHVVTDMATLRRAHTGTRHWTAEDLSPGVDDEVISTRCGWQPPPQVTGSVLTPADNVELTTLNALTRTMKGAP